MDSTELFEFEIDGKTISAKKGQTIAEALLASGVRIFRKTTNNAARSAYCNMGVCYECRMVVDGTPNVRTCMTPAAPGCKVSTQEDANIKVEDERS